MRWPAVVTLAAAVGSAWLVLACGGNISGVAGSDGGGSNGGSSGGTSPVGGPCPAATPTAGTACASAAEGVSCEYGDDPNLACDQVVTCTAGRWKATSPSTTSSCPTPIANGGACPDSYGAAESAGACSATGTSCAYTQGRCECAISSGGPPTGGTKSATWLCDDPGSGCPMPRPRLGSECNPSDLQCSYGACSLPDGVELACTSGLWQQTSTVCAL